MSLEEQTNTNVRIELHSNNNHLGDNVFRPGEKIGGRVNVFCPSPIKIRGILVRFSGKAKCQFTEYSGERTMTHIGDETYVEHDIYLLGSGQGTMRLESGSSYYSFEYQLPDSIPMSLTSSFGNIRYWISVILKRPKRFDSTKELDLIIKTELDLNEFPELKTPIELEWIKHYFVLGVCICLKTGNFFMRANVACSGYVAGSRIFIKLHINNQSDHPMKSFTITLVELLTCHSHPIKDPVFDSVENVLAEEIIEGCAGNGIDERRISIAVPSGSDFRPSDEQSNVLKLKHVVKITGQAGRFHIDPEISIPVKLGTVNWIRRPSIAPSDVGVEIATLANNVYQAEYMNWNIV